MVAEVMNGDGQGSCGAYDHNVRLRKAYAENHPMFQVMYRKNHHATARVCGIG